MTAIIATVANPECVRIIARRQARRQARKQAGNAPTPAIANFNNTPHRNKPMNRALTAARRLLAPLAVAAMLLGLASNAAAQAPTFPTTPGIGTMPGFAGTIMLFYPPGVAITPTTFPEATNTGTGTVIYALNPPTGLTFDASTRILTGTPVAATATYAATYSATDSVTTGQSSVSAMFTICPTGAVAAGNVSCTAPTYSALMLTAPSDQTYTANTAIAAVTLPAATGGTTGGTAALPTEVYSIAPIPSGLAFDPATRVLSGTPDTVAAAATITYRVQDAGSPPAVGRNATLTFTITINDPPPLADTTAPAFAAGATISPQRYVTGKMITPLTLPAATGGDGPIVYSMLAPNGAAITDLSLIIAGLTLDTTARTITGTPSTSSSARNFSWAAHDSDANMASGDRATLGFNITVQENLAPAFADGASIADQNYLQNSPIMALTLPTATGGNPPLTYTLTPAIPGLTLNPNTGVLTGTPTAAATTAEYTYTANDGDDDTVTLTFNVVVAADLVPTLGTATIADQAFVVGDTVALNLPLVTAGSGNISIAYTLTPALPAGLTFDGAARPPTITGSPTAAAATMEYTYMTTDGDGNTAVGDTDMLTFNLVVDASDTAPAFADDAMIPEQTYTQGVTITPLTFPEATGGNAPLTYTLTRPDPLPPGLTFNGDLRPPTLTGTTTLGEIRMGVLSRLTVTDNNGDSAMLSFVIHLDAPDTAPTFAADVSIADIVYLTGEVVNQTLPQPDGGNTPIVYSLTPALPPGLTFVIGIDPATITGTVGANAIASVDYTLTAADSDPTGDAGDEDTLMFSITVEEDTAPAFATNASIPALASYPQGAAITPLTFPEATGGNGDLTYALTSTGAMPAGLTFNGDARPPTLTGTPAFAGSVTYSYTVTDADSNTVGTDSAVLTFTFVATASATTLDFPSSTHTLYYPLGAAITPTTFPAATGGVAPLTYAVVSGGMPPAGLTFDSTNRILSGTPSAAGVSRFNYEVADSATPTPDNDLLETTIVICESGGMADGGTACPTPAFVPLALPTPDDQVFANTRLITDLTLPEATAGGYGTNPVRIYTATPLPVGLGFNPSTRVISGRPEAVGTTTVNYRVGDAGAGDADTQSTTVTFDIVVGPVLSFGAITSQSYAVGETVELTLLTGLGGTPPFSYALTAEDGGALTLPAGLTWNTDVTPQTITGIPTTVAAQTNYRYGVTDSLGLSQSITFTITVTAAAADTAPTGITLSLNPAAVPESADPTTITVTATVVGGTFAVERSISFGTFAGVGTAIQGTDYTAVPATNLTIPANMASASTTFPFTAAVDSVAEPAGETVRIGGLLNAIVASDGTDSSISVTFATLTINDPVAGDISPDFAADASIDDQSFTVGETVALTLPGVTPGTGNISIAYTLTPALPAGLTFNAGVRPQPTITGSPTAAAASAQYTYLVTDGDTNTARTDTDMLTFNLVVTAPVLAFTGNVSTLTLYYPLGAAITATTLPAATGGTSPYMYDMPGATLPAGLTFDAATRTLSGTPSAAGSSSFNYRVTDNAMPAAMVSLEVTTVICESGGMADGGTVCAAPAFVPLALATPAEQAFQHILPITTPVTLPEATGGSGASPMRIYTLTPLPAGLAFDPATRAISGRPEELGTFPVNYRVGDAGAGNADTQSTTVMFDIVVFSRPLLPAPSSVVYAVGDTVALTLTTGERGTPPYTYALSNQGAGEALTLPAGLTFNDAARPPTITGMPTAATALLRYRYEVTDARSVTNSSTFSITVNAEADIAPDFDTATVPDQFYTVGTAIPDLTLPAATPGNGATTYVLTAPPGLNFDPSTRVLSGTPTTAAGVTTYSYAASDADFSTDTLTIRITVNAAGTAPTGLTLSFDPATVTESATATTITVTATFVGGTFTTERVVTFNSRTGDGTAGTATEVDDYTAVSNTNLTIPANAASGTTTFPFTAAVDTVAEPDGETVEFEGSLFLMGTTLPFDTTVTVTGATITINDPVVANAPTGVTLSVNPATVTESATPTDITLTATFVGGTFGEDRTAFFRTQGGTATAAGTDYTGVPRTDITIPANAASGSVTIAFTANVDTDVEADGETVFFTGGLRNLDGTTDTSFTVSRTTLTINDPVAANTAPAFSVTSITAQTFTIGTAVDLTLPTATGGNGAITYTLLPAIPGLTLDAATGVLTGMPTTVAGATTYTYTAGDTDGSAAGTDEATLTVSVTVNAAAAAVQPDFLQLISTVLGGPEGVTALATPTTFEATAAGATVALTLSGPDAAFFSITQAGALSFRTAPDFEMPRGMAFNSVTNTNTYRVTVTATATPGGLTRDAALTVTITDVDETADTAPTFGTETVAAQVFTMGTAVDLTLPVATGGNAPYTYTLVPGLLAPALPDGLIFNAAARTLTGTPTTAAAAADYTYTAADADMNTAADDTASLTISITVSEATVVDSAPTFGGARIPPQVYTVAVPVNLTLPLPTSNIGDAPFTYDLLDSAGTVIPDLSAVIPGLTFTAAARTITGTPTGALVSTNFAYRVSDSDANMAPSDADSLSFSITVNTVEQDTAPTFFVDSFRELIFVVNVPIEPITLPSASGGNVAIVYGLSSPPVGLNFEPSTRVLSGTPTEVRVRTIYGYSVRDTDANSAGDDADTLLLGITVTARAGNLVPAFADGASIATQNYIVGSPITPLTLPVATGGDGTLVYSLRHTGANTAVITDLSTVIPGLTLDIAARTITGTPTTASGAAINYTWNAEDTDNDLVNLTFGISVLANAVPTFDTGSQRIANQAYFAGQTVLVTLPPTATSGNGPTMYTLTPALPDGLTFNSNPNIRTITGMPTTETASAEYTYTAGDSDSNTLPADEASLMFTVTVTGETAGTAPSFGTATDEPRTYIAGLAIEPLTLPVATGGDGAITYTLTGPSNAALNTAVPGLTFDAATRTLSGTPTTVAASTDLTYTAGDTDGSAPGTDEVTLTLSITIEAGTSTAPPTFGGATVSPQAYFVGTAITSLTLPVATGGTGAITYTLTPALPTGLIFNATARTITGTASAAAGATDYTYTATDGDMNTATLMFSITIDAMDTAPAFAGSASITAQTYMVNTAIMPLTLPAVTDGTGNGAITYTLSPAIPGLTLNPTSRVLTGTPTTVPTVTMYTYTAADSDGTTGAGDEDTLSFSITVMQAPPSAIRLSVNPAEVTESSDATDITLTATLIGGMFTAEQTITFASTDGTATAGTDYTAVGNTVLTIPANMASGTMTFSFTATVDEVAEPAGETVLFGMGAVVEMITVTPATLTINDYDLVVNAGDDQTVASGATITLNGEVPTSFTDITTTWALSDSAATRAALEAAGLTTAEATTEVGRLTTALAGTGPDRTFPAPAANLGLTDPVALAFTLTVTDNAPPGGQDAATAMDEVTITVEANTTAVTTTLNEAILPEVTRALVHSTSSSITRRVGQAVGSIPVPTAGSFNLAGQQMGGERNLAAALRTHGEAMSEDSRDIKEILAGSEFVLPLNAGGAGIDTSTVAFWGSGEYRDFSGESDDLDWDGDLTGFQLGLDARLRNNLLVGVAVSMLETDVDYQDDTGILGQGDYELDLTSAHPYIGWRADELDLWATVGYGTGDLEITGQGETPQSGDVNLQTIGGGGSGMLWQDGTTTLRLKAEVSQTQLEVKGSDDFAKQEIDATGIRIAVEATRPRTLDGGGIFEPSVEVAARYDGGDGETGGGAEVGGALRYRNPATGLTADGRIRALVGQGGDYEEWGISGTIRVAPGTDGQGLSFSLRPGYGNSASGIQELWRHGLADDETTTDDYAMKLDARIGYGLGFTLNQHHGILTPYSEITYGNIDSYRMGLNWAANTRFDLTLLGERRQPTTAPVEHAVLLKGEVRF